MLTMLDEVHPEKVLAELLASWKAGACAAGHRLVSEIDGLASHIGALREGELAGKGNETCDPSNNNENGEGEVRPHDPDF
jgi:hypothetical protein